MLCIPMDIDIMYIQYAYLYYLVGLKGTTRTPGKMWLLLYNFVC
jgi:hypothetical protein